jgi:hypothetical protein
MFKDNCVSHSSRVYFNKKYCFETLCCVFFFKKGNAVRSFVTPDIQKVYIYRKGDGKTDNLVQRRTGNTRFCCRITDPLYISVKDLTVQLHDR